jgi:iron complex transport system substrate-binding protein
MRRINFGVVGLLLLGLVVVSPQATTTATPAATTQAATTAAATTAVAAASTTAATTSAATTVAPTTAAASATTPAVTTSSTTAAASQTALTVTDNNGITITLPKKAERVVCLSAHCLDMLAELGLEPAGVEELYYDIPNVYFNDPKYWANKASSFNRIKSGTTAAPNLEDIAKIKPDLIVAVSATEIRDALKNVAPIYATKYRTLAGRLESLRDVGKLTGREAQAEAAIKRFQDKLAAYAAKSPKTKTILYTQGYSFIGIPTADSPTGEVIKQVTKYPWSSDKPSPTNGWGPISLEKILEVDPDVILSGVVNSGNATNDFIKGAQAGIVKALDELKVNPLWKELKAVKNNQLYEVDLLNWQGQGTIALTLVLDELMPKLYPEVFPKPLP